MRMPSPSAAQTPIGEGQPGTAPTLRRAHHCRVNQAPQSLLPSAPVRLQARGRMVLDDVGARTVTVSWSSNVADPPRNDMR